MGKNGDKKGQKRAGKSRGRLNLYYNLSSRANDTKFVKKVRSASVKAKPTIRKSGNWFQRAFDNIKSGRFFKYWFSKRGAVMALKIVGVGLLVTFLLVGALFAYFRKDLDAIRPGEINKRVQNTVITYLDRNGKTLWEDKGDGNYKLVVESDELGEHLKHATIAIEDKDFYNHGGVSASGLMRAAINNIRGGSTQGGSTLTQQLVKQVFFAAEAQDRSLTGIPRKIKEIILSIEVERMYDKDQILTLYLNESPYGGRRNGAESGAQTYFGKSAKDLSIAEAALLAAIPQNPAVYDPYNVAGHAGLIARQHTVIDNMQDQGYITQEEAEQAKNYPIIDHIIPETSRYAGIKAAHFIQMVQADLEQQLGATVVGRGGLTVQTTLDIRAQNKLEEAMKDMFSSYLPDYAGFSNGAATVEDTQTGQIIALMGSRDFSWPGYGQDNAAISYVQPGSTIKPLVYAELFERKPSGQMNYGSGTILKDENIDNIYGATVRNADQTFKGNLSIRSSLATSRNIPAIKAMYISGVDNTLDTIRNLGATSYCTQGTETQVGLASAIGGCGVKQVDLVNAFSSLSREGVYKPTSTVLEVKNNANETLYKWSDPAGERIIDAQSAYIVSDILNDDVARSPLSGRFATGMYIPGVPTATKTGTSDRGGAPRDIWMVSYSPVLAMGVWLGNSDASVLRQGTSAIPGSIIAKVVEYVHKEIYAKEGKWKQGQWFSAPSGIQRSGGDVYPSWWSKNQGQSDEKLTFSRVSKKRAISCTPEGARIEIDVVKMVDPVTGKDVYIAPDGYDATKDDDCKNNVPPSAPVINTSPGSDSWTINVSVTSGTLSIDKVEIRIDDVLVASIKAPGPYNYVYNWPSGDVDNKTVKVTVIDKGYFTSTATTSIDEP